MQNATQPEVKMSYYDEKCFPISNLKTKIQEGLYPFTNIHAKSIVKKDKKNRLQLTLANRNGERKTVSLLLSVEYGKDGTKNKYFINTMSWDNVVVAYKKLVSMQNELDEELKDGAIFQMENGSQLMRNDDDEILIG
jgi:hypothetical protein